MTKRQSLPKTHGNLCNLLSNNRARTEAVRDEMPARQKA